MAKLFFRLRGTVITKIWWQVILYTLYTVAICVFHDTVEPIIFDQTLAGILGVLLGLLLAFRASIAHERYLEARRQWTNLANAIRQFTRCVWIFAKENSAKDLVEKKSAVNLAVAFSFATKHYVRGEYKYDYADMASLIGGVPRFGGSSADPEAHANVKNGRILAYDVTTPTNIPMEIAYHLSTYVKSVVMNGNLDGSATHFVNEAVTTLVNTLGHFERILRTPLPLSYAAHLHHIVALYLITLPFQLVSTLQYWTIPGLLFTSFCLLGILQIGWEIEHPFGYGDNDLPLDDICWTIRSETEQITCTKFSEVEEWILSDENRPLAPYAEDKAPDLANCPLEQVIHKLKEAGTISTQKYKTRKEWEQDQKKVQ